MATGERLRVGIGECRQRLLERPGADVVEAGGDHVALIATAPARTESTIVW